MQYLLFVIVFFLSMLFFLKIFGIIRHSNRDEGFAFFLLLNLSWIIIWLNIFKKIINNRVSLSKKLNLDEYLQPNIYLVFISIVVTLFQLIMILLGKFYELKS